VFVVASCTAKFVRAERRTGCEGIWRAGWVPLVGRLYIIVYIALWAYSRANWPLPAIAACRTRWMCAGLGKSHVSPKVIAIICQLMLFRVVVKSRGLRSSFAFSVCQQ
jgi:hypothetical protein